MNELATQIRSVIGIQLGMDAQAVTDDISFVDDFGVDSLEAIELVMALEEEFGVEISDQDCSKLACVSDAIACVQFKLSHARPSKPRDVDDVAQALSMCAPHQGSKVAPAGGPSHQ